MHKGAGIAASPPCRVVQGHGVSRPWLSAAGSAPVPEGTGASPFPVTGPTRRPDLSTRPCTSGRGGQRYGFPRTVSSFVRRVRLCVAPEGEQRRHHRPWSDPAHQHRSGDRRIPAVRLRWTAVTASVRMSPDPSAFGPVPEGDPSVRFGLSRCRRVRVRRALRPDIRFRADLRLDPTGRRGSFRQPWQSASAFGSVAVHVRHRLAPIISGTTLYPSASASSA